MRIALGVEYDGTGLFGWLAQPDRATAGTMDRSRRLRSNMRVTLLKRDDEKASSRSYGDGYKILFHRFPGAFGDMHRVKGEQRWTTGMPLMRWKHPKDALRYALVDLVGTKMFRRENRTATPTAALRLSENAR